MIFRLRTLVDKIELANFCTLFFFGALLFYIFTGQFHRKAETETLMLLAAFLFMNSIHIIFQYWFMENSPDFKAAALETMPRMNTSLKWLGLTLAVAVIIFLLKICKLDLKLPLILVALWGTWHSIRQTGGLYAAHRLGHEAENAFLPDLRFFKNFVLVVFAMKVILFTDMKFHYLPNSHILEVKILFSVITFLLLGSGIYLAFKDAPKNRGHGWILFRFFFWGLSFFSPLGTVAVGAIHGSEYFDLTRKIKRRSNAPLKSRFFIWLFPLGLGFLLFEGTMGKFMSVSEDSALGIAIISVSLALNLIHYTFDTFAFRLRKPAARKLIVQLIK